MSYKRLPGEADDTIGVVREADNAFIPHADENADWITYQEWLAEPNTLNPATAHNLASYRDTAKTIVDQHASRAMHAQDIPGLIGHLGLAVALMVEEAIGEAEGEGADSTRCPILNELTDDGATIADRATAIRSWWRDGSPSRASICGQIMKEVRATYAAIDGAADTDEVDAAVAAMDFSVS